VKPDEIDAVGDALIEAGITVLEVPLNSPQAVREHRPAGRGAMGIMRWSAPAPCWKPPMWRA
jgi:2-dehydro-3-deoxyphosphogalactonate aldolase